ncbi:hypothetical protein ACFFUA_36415, partial [Streptomyces heliomycini]
MDGPVEHSGDTAVVRRAHHGAATGPGPRGGRSRCERADCSVTGTMPARSRARSSGREGVGGARSGVATRATPS